MSSLLEPSTDSNVTEFGRSALATAFAAAAEAAGGVTERHFVFAGNTVTLRFAGERLTHLTEAFEHLATPPPRERSALCVHLWDTSSTGVAAPEPPFEGRVGEPAGLRVLWQQPPLRAVLQPGQHTMNAIDEASGDAWFWCEQPDALPFWEHSAPIRMILHWWLSSRGQLLIHAAAVGFDDGGALIVGKGGSGKSTTSLLALRYGLRFASDDYVGLEPAPTPETWPVVHSIFGSGKLTAEQYANFPELHPGIVNADKLDTEKAVVFVRRVAPHLLVRDFPLRAVLVPRITGQPRTTTRRISAIAALAGLAPSTIFQLPGRAELGLSAMAAVARQVPTFSLELGTDLDAVPAAIAELLRSLGVSDT